MISRGKTFEAESVWKEWFREAHERTRRSQLFHEAEEFERIESGEADADTWLLQGSPPLTGALSHKPMVVTISLPNKHSFWMH